MVLWGLSLIRYVALLSLSHYEVCRQLWGVSLIGFVALWGLSLYWFCSSRRFVANYGVYRLLSLSQYEVCRQLWGVSLIEFVAVTLHLTLPEPNRSTSEGTPLLPPVLLLLHICAVWKLPDTQLLNISLSILRTKLSFRILSETLHISVCPEGASFFRSQI